MLGTIAQNRSVPGISVTVRLSNAHTSAHTTETHTARTIDRTGAPVCAILLNIGNPGVPKDWVVNPGSGAILQTFGAPFTSDAAKWPSVPVCLKRTDDRFGAT